MRITSGAAKGHTIKVPKILDIRPAQEVVRLAVFSILGEQVKGAKVLELYAGSGAYGLEALSRGADHATFVDNNPLACQAIEQNLQHARFWGRAEVVKLDAIRYFIDCHEDFDLVFLAPPYSYGIAKPLLFHIAEHLNKDGIALFDHARASLFPKDLEGLEIVDQRSYGATAITMLRHAEDKR